MRISKEKPLRPNPTGRYQSPDTGGQDILKIWKAEAFKSGGIMRPNVPGLEYHTHWSIESVIYYPL